jgi:RND family efflux transporter MFP subunit
LYRKDLIARREVAEVETLVQMTRLEKDLARSQLEQRRAAIAQVRYLLSLTRIPAPLSGIVTRTLVRLDERVPAAAPLVTIAAIAALNVAVELSALEIDRLPPITRAEIVVDALPTRRFSGSILRITDGGSSGTKRTVEVRVANQDGLLKPGMEALVSLPVNDISEVIVVPSGAVFEIARQKYLYTVDGDTARLKRVDTAWEKAGQVAITSNVNYGDKVVVSSSKPLTPDARVRIID